MPILRSIRDVLLRLPGPLLSAAIGVLKRLQNDPRAPRRVVLSNHATPEVRAKCADLGAEKVFDKSNEIDEMLAYCNRLAASHATAAITPPPIAIRSGAIDFLDKPLSSERVIVTLQNALRQSELRSENRELKLAMESRYEIVGQSPALRKVLEAVQRESGEKGRQPVPLADLLAARWSPAP